MNQCEETEEEVHPSETPLCGQHDNQTKAQRLDSGVSSSSYSEKDDATSDVESVLSPDSGISLRSRASSVSSCVSNQSKRSKDHDINFKKKRRDFRDSSSSDSKKKVATVDGVSVLSSDSWLDSGESPSDSEDVATSDDDSVHSSHSGISLGSPAFSGSSCVSNQSKRSKDLDTDFKKKLGSLESLSSDLKKDSFRSSDSRRLDSSESLFSHLLKDVATSDDDSVHSSHSGISLERKVSSGSIDMSRKRRKTESYAHSSTFKKKCTYAMGQFEETEEGVHPSETPLCGQHDNQTKAQSTSSLLVPTPATSASAPQLVSGESSSSDSVDVAANDDDSDQSSHSRISLKSQASSGSSCESNQSKKSKEYDINFKKKENEKTSPPTTQELVVGSSAGIETKSTNPPVAAD